MNEIMKVLTIISTIFIPITFLVGLCGMNFVHMPEIRWRWGYGFVWVLIVASVGTMFAFFRRKKWL
jgi:magnesium transporter